MNPKYLAASLSLVASLVTCLPVRASSFYQIITTTTLNDQYTVNSYSEQQINQTDLNFTTPTQTTPAIEKQLNTIDLTTPVQIDEFETVSNPDAFSAFYASNNPAIESFLTEIANANTALYAPLNTGEMELAGGTEIPEPSLVIALLFMAELGSISNLQHLFKK